MTAKSQSLNATEHAVGLDGYFTLLLSNIVLLCTGGLYWLWLLKAAYARAKNTPVAVNNCDLIVVLGMRPHNDQINLEFKTRLNRAVTLFDQGYAKQILVLGGKTGNNPQSEAQLGIQYLLDRGLPQTNLLAEDHSRHTLENLHNARRLVCGKQDKTAALITSRYHLERSHRMSRSLQLSHKLCAAEAEFKLHNQIFINLLKEAYFIHWFEVGKTWSFAVNNRKSLNRIS